MKENVEILVYNLNDLTSPLETISRRWDPTVLEELNRDGGGSFKLLKSDPLLTADPTLLQEGRVVQVKLKGQKMQFWEIQKIHDVLIDTGEYAGLYKEFSGPSIRDWLSHGVVLPQSGLASVSDDRNFNYSSARGSWYVDADWKAPVSLGLVHLKTGPWGAALPKGWPKNLHAEWIWDRVNNASNPPPAGDVYFRREFTTSSTKDYRIVATADDYAAILINGERVMAITEFAAHARVFTVDVTLPAGNHVLAVKGRQIQLPGGTPGAGRGSGGFLMAMCNISDGVDDYTEKFTDSDRVLWTGDNMSLWKINAYPVRPPGFTVGGVLKSLFDEAVTRGVDTLSKMTLGFTDLVDSYGVPWQTIVDPSFKVGDSLLEVASQLSDGYADIWVDENLVLHCAPERGVDRSVSVAGNDPVAFRAAQNVLSASTEGTAEIANTAFVKTAKGIVENTGPAGSKSLYGRRETYVSAVNASENGTEPILTQQIFDKFAFPRRTPTLEIRADDGFIPFQDFGVGDWILAPSDSDSNALIKRRVVSVAASEDSETGETVYTCEIDTIQQTTEERLARWLQENGNSSKSGGISGTSTGSVSSGDIPAADGNSGTRPVPIPPDTRQPNPPGALTLSADILNNDQGVPVGQMHAAWTHDGLATDDTDLEIRVFNVYYRQNGTTNFKQMVSSSTTSVDYSPLPVVAVNGTALKYDIYVVAVAMNGVSSAPSTTVTLTMSKDVDPPLQPSIPIVLADHTVFAVVWDGKDFNGAAMAVDFDYCAVEWWNSVAWVQIHTVGKNSRATIPGLSIGTHKFRLVAYDFSGNASSPSAEVSATSVELVNDQSIADAIAALDTRIDDVVVGAGGNAIRNEIIDPDEDGVKEGDVWQKWDTLSVGGKLLKSWRWYSGTWIAQSMDPTYLPLVDLGSGTFGTLNGGRMEIGSIQAKSLVLASTDNQLAEPAFTDSGNAWNVSPGARDIIPGVGRSGGSVLRLTGTGGINSAYNEPRLRPVSGDPSWYVSTWLKSSINAPAGIFWAFAACYNTAGVPTFKNVVSPALTAGVWTEVTGSIDAPAGTVAVSFALSVRETFTVGATLDIDFSSFTRKGDSNLIVDGDILARHIDINSLTADSGFIGQARTNILSVGSVPTKALQVGMDELMRDPMWMDSGYRSQYPATNANWAWSTDPVTFINGQTNTLGISAPAVGNMWLGDGIPVSPGEKFWLGVTVRLSTAFAYSGSVNFGIEYSRADGTAFANSLVGVPSATTKNVSVTLDNIFTAPNGAATAKPRIWVAGTGLTAGGIWFQKVSWRRVIGSSNAAGQAAEVSPQGMRLFDSEGAEVVTLTSTPPNALTIKDSATGDTLADISSTGNISGQGLSAENTLYYQGTELTDILEAMPQGLVAWASRSTGGLYWAGSAAQPYLHLRFAAKAGRSYRVSTSPIGIDSEGTTSDPVVYLHYETANANASTSSQVIAKGIAAQGTSASRRSPVTFNRLITPPDGDVSLLISYGVVSNSRAKISVSSGQASVVLSVEDMGLAVPMTGEYRDGSGDSGSVDPTPPAAIKNYEKTYYASGTRSYTGSGSTYAYNTGYMYSGLSPSGYGDLSSIAVFPSMTGDLSGATISDIWVYVYYDFWYQGSGGIAAVYLHGLTSLPSTKPSMSFAQTSSGWPRGSGRWVRLSPALYAGFKSGSWRGFGLGGHGGGYAEYGYAHGARIKVRYTK